MADSAVAEADWPDGVAIDVGCGSGGLTFLIAEWVPWVIGLDVSESILAQARETASRLKVSNADFHRADAESSDYRTLCGSRPVLLVISSLCMSDAIIHRAAEALAPGRAFVFACLEMDQWKETGCPSRFAYDAETLQRRLQESGFELLDFQLERITLEFDTVEEMTERFFDDGFLKQRWQRDGRWDAYLSYVRSGGRSFTARSQLLVNCVRAVR